MPNNSLSCMWSKRYRYILEYKHYHIKFHDQKYEHFYIGQTSKTLCKRINQHQIYVGIVNENSDIFNHVKEFTHKMILYNFKDFYSRNIVESIIIKSSFQHNEFKLWIVLFRRFD